MDEVAYTPGAVARTVAHRASITIIEGCNKNCTFCVVPMTRGRERNRRLAEIVDESRRLVGEGVVEIELLGQTVNAYSDPVTGERLPTLLRALSGIAGLRRLRFVTSHPRDFDDDLIAAMAESAVVCPALHLPFQSGSDRILGRMKRQYTRGEYLDLIGRLRAAIPGIAMSTDIIVGFPGETEEDFAATISVLDEVRFSSIFCFTYSPRPRTAAARWDLDVPIPVAQERLVRLNDHQQALQLQANEALVGRVFEVLVEGSDRTGQRVSGRSPFNHLVHVDGIPGTPAGTFVMRRRREGSFELPRSATASPVTLCRYRRHGPRVLIRAARLPRFDTRRGAVVSVRMDVKALIVDPIANMPVVILRDAEDKNFLPIWVGVFEANAIALQLEGVRTPRPMTHDLLKETISLLGCQRRSGRHHEAAREHVLRGDPPHRSAAVRSSWTAARRMRSPWHSGPPRRSSWRRKSWKGAGPRTTSEEDAEPRTPPEVVRGSGPGIARQVQDVTSSNGSGVPRNGSLQALSLDTSSKSP